LDLHFFAKKNLIFFDVIKKRTQLYIKSQFPHEATDNTNKGKDLFMSKFKITVRLNNVV